MTYTQTHMCARTHTHTNIYIFEPTNPGMEYGRGTKVPSCLYRLGELFGCAYIVVEFIN